MKAELCLGARSTSVTSAMAAYRWVVLYHASVPRAVLVKLQV